MFWREETDPHMTFGIGCDGLRSMRLILGRERE